MLKLLKPLSIALAVIATQFIASAGELNFYSSGSTGVDGPFAPEVVDAVSGPKLQGAVPNGSRVFVSLKNSVKTFYVIVPLPQNGVFNFTSFNLPTNHVMAFDTRGTTNPGVVILATSDVVINGQISVTSGDTLLANDPDLVRLPDRTKIYRSTPGPGGFRGGISPGFGANKFGTGPDAPDCCPLSFTLPLTGGRGMNDDSGTVAIDQTYITRAGGGGTLIVASSKKVIFGNPVPLKIYASARSTWFNSPGNLYLETSGGDGVALGSAMVIANETKGQLPLDNYSINSRILVCAFEQEYFFSNSMSPAWPVGIRGADMPVDPSARFAEFAGKELTAVGEPDRVILEKSGEYKLVVETSNLPPGIIFGCTLRRLKSSDGSELSNIRSTLNFPPTVTTATGICRAEMMIPITPGGTYITAIATKPIETVYSPIIHGEPLTEMVAQLDLQGGQSIHFKTASGLQVDAATARREALKQGKARFPAFKS
jgi:hypothetical protein